MFSPKRESENIDYEVILTTLGYTTISQVKSVFDSEGITYLVQGEDLLAAPGPLPARILVKKEQAEEAKELLKAFELL